MSGRFEPALHPYTQEPWPGGIYAPAGWNVTVAEPTQYDKESMATFGIDPEQPDAMIRYLGHAKDWAGESINHYRWDAWLFVPGGMGLENDLCGTHWFAFATGRASLQAAVSYALRGARELEEERDRLLREFDAEPWRLFADLNEIAPLEPAR